MSKTQSPRIMAADKIGKFSKNYLWQLIDDGCNGIFIGVIPRDWYRSRVNIVKSISVMVT